jgi:DHA1 family multidrug resistance protein-like MFS transporter
LCIGGLLPAANALLARGVPREQQGAIYGISASMSQLGAAAGPMLGAGLATALTFRAAFAGAAAVALLLALGVGVLVKPEVRRLAVRQGDSSDLAR